MTDRGEAMKREVETDNKQKEKRLKIWTLRIRISKQTEYSPTISKMTDHREVLSREKSPVPNKRLWRHAGCNFAESLVRIWKFVARPNFSVPPPERQAANR